LRARNAVDRRTRDQVAIEGDRAGGVILAGDQEGDAVRGAIGVDHRRNRQTEAARLLDRALLLVGVDHEHEVRQPAHALDASDWARSMMWILLRVPKMYGPIFGFQRWA